MQNPRIKIDVPCKDCLTLPACKKKPLNKLTQKCSILDKFIEEHSIRHKEGGMRLTEVKALWNVYEYTM